MTEARIKSHDKCFSSIKTVSITLRSGGRDRMNSKMTACASFFTRGGMSPFTITFLKLYFLLINLISKTFIRAPDMCSHLDRMSSINISYGVSVNSVGGCRKLIFFSLTPRRNSSTTCIQNLACESREKEKKKTNVS